MIRRYPLILCDWFQKIHKKLLQSSLISVDSLHNSGFYWDARVYVNYKIAYVLSAVMPTLYEELLTGQ
jgi:hypothetical protein